ncbi:hypothetical protein BOX15_Mlig010408g1 [Macrostomum lignano]|uniref:Uncharacterized protein n=1 Tax=Macrostomum lignano TaxID=282301 RepID=A0A267E8R4_9PLAT|nr:hypothetical protein BOX15_Mlig010408g1 [Macrostomum lignano]
MNRTSDTIDANRSDYITGNVSLPVWILKQLKVWLTNVLLTGIREVDYKALVVSFSAVYLAFCTVRFIVSMSMSAPLRYM